MAGGKGARGWLKHAARHLEASRPDLARVAAREALRERTPEPAAFRELARIYERLGEPELSLAVLRDGALRTGDPELYLAWAERFRRPEEGGEKSFVLQLGADRSPEDLPLQMACIEALLEVGRTQMARARAESVLSMAPDHPQVLELWARVHAALDEPELAAETLTAVLDKLERPEAVVLQLARHRCTLRDFSGAMELLQRHGQLETDAEYHVVLAKARVGAGDPEGGLRSLRAALRTDPYRLEAYLEMGRLQLQLKRPEDARVAAEAAQKLAPDRAEPWCLRGDAEWAMANREAALRAFLKAASLAPDDPILRSRVSEVMQQEATGSISADLTTLSLAEALQKLEQREATGRLEVDGPSGERIRFRLWEGRLVHAESGLDHLDPTRSGWIHAKDSNEDMEDTQEAEAEDRIVHALASALRFRFGQLRFRPEDTSSPWDGVHPALALAKAARKSRQSKEATPT